MTLKTAIIGLGKQMVEDHLPAAVESGNFEVKAVCDVNSEKVNNISGKYQLEGFDDLEKMLTKIKFDVAIVAVPHHQYHSVISKLAERKIHVIKEKPFAVSREEALKFHQLASQNNLFLGVTLQRRFNPIYQAFHQLKKRIGKDIRNAAVVGFEELLEHETDDELGLCELLRAFWPGVQRESVSGGCISDYGDGLG